MFAYFKHVRVVSLVVAFVAILSVGSMASAKNQSARFSLQATVEPTEMDIDAPVALTFDKASVSPLDKDTVTHRIFSFSGKANDVVTVVSTRGNGNFGYSVTINSQNDVELARVNGGFLQSNYLTVKLPQDGKYTIRISIEDPGTGDSEAGTVSVMVTTKTPSFGTDASGAMAGTMEATSPK